MVSGKATSLACAYSDTEKAEILDDTTFYLGFFELCVAKGSNIIGDPQLPAFPDHEEMRDFLLQSHDTTSSTLGNLESLPLEILRDIFLLLDIRSLFNFRHANRRARQIVKTARGFETIVTHAYKALFVILKTSIASWFTLPDLYTTFCTRDCSVCGFFGGFIFLPSLTRCCFSCIRDDHIPSTLTIAAVKRRFKMKPGSDIYNLLPIVRSLPSKYTEYQVRCERRLEIVPIEAVRSFSLSERKPSMFHFRRRVKTEEKESLRYMVATALPYFDVESGVIERGRSCKGCQQYSSRSPDNSYGLRKVFSDDEFMSHFRECQWAQSWWNEMRSCRAGRQRYLSEAEKENMKASR